MRPYVMIIASSLVLASCAHGGMGPGPHAGMGDRPMHMMAGMGAMAGCPGHDAEAHLTHLREALSITPAQDSAWNAYAAAYREHAASMPMRRSGIVPMAGAAPERMRQHEEMMANQLELMRTLRATLESLYAVLTPQQRAAADALQCRHL